MKIVPLSELKLGLGIAADDSSQDARLTQLEAGAATWLEGKTKRFFSQPVEYTEYKQGSGRRVLYLSGHVDGSGSVVVAERAMLGGVDWTELTADQFERRGDSLIRLDWSFWAANMEYRLTYPNGYAVAPQDIKDVVIEMVQGVLDGETELAGVQSERIGDYSYSLADGGVIGTGTLSQTALDTVNHYERKLI